MVRDDCGLEHGTPSTSARLGLAVLLFATKETGFITLGTMLIACVCVLVWRLISKTELFDKNKYIFILLAHAAALAGAIYYNGKIIEGAKWFHETMVPKDLPAQLLVFFGIVVVAIAALAAWIIFLIRLKEAQETSLVEPAEITWSSFYKKLGAGPDSCC